VTEATPAAAVPALGLTDVRVRRGRRDVLHIPALDVIEGETLAVLGPNGAGKSTLLLTAALLLPVTSGSVSLFGERAERRDLVRLRRKTSTVFQEPALLDMSVRRNLETALGLHGIPRAERRTRSEAWLHRLGVAHLAEAMPHTLSGGEARRVSLARAFAIGPRLLFLDEPFSALDLETRAELVGDLRVLLRDEGTTALLVTHDHSEALLLADRVAVLVDGELAQLDATAPVFERPATPEVAAFLGYSVVDRDKLPADAVAGVRGATVGVPPAAVRLVHREAGLPAEVVAVQGAHGQGRLLVRAGEAVLAVALRIEEINARQLHPGAAVRIQFEPALLVSWDELPD
jgi:tungstate transport system ATP-binding protein